MGSQRDGLWTSLFCLREVVRLLIISDDYPNRDHLYGDVFAHTRVKEYSRNHECIVCSTKNRGDYSYEGVSVRSFGTQSELLSFVSEWSPHAVLVHFAFKRTIDSVLLKLSVPLVVWVHGHEALRFDKTRFSLPWASPKSLYRSIYSNILQLLSFKRLVEASHQGRDISFVFVSEWMRRECEASIGVRVQRYDVIPNPIDDEFFSYRPKSTDKRFNVLSIRSFSSKKYANDLSASAIETMSLWGEFSKFQFRLFGKGRYFDAIKRRLDRFENVVMTEGFLTHHEIKQQHEWAGIFLCPSRMDAQGVSMCEAMASGLVPLTSKNTAIPEFVAHDRSGYTTNNAAELADLMLGLARDAGKFGALSRAAAEAIRKKAAISLVIERELRLIEDLVRVAP